MNSKKTNLRLIENITVQVHSKYTASIRKDILFHVSKFFGKMIFQRMFEIIKSVCQLQVLLSKLLTCSKLLVSNTTNFF